MDEGEQITAIYQDYERFRERAVGLYRVQGKKRAVHVWAEDDYEARKIAAYYAKLTDTTAEPVLEEPNGSRTGE